MDVVPSMESARRLNDAAVIVFSIPLLKGVGGGEIIGKLSNQNMTGGGFAHLCVASI